MMHPDHRLELLLAGEAGAAALLVAAALFTPAEARSTAGAVAAPPAAPAAVAQARIAPARGKPVRGAPGKPAAGPPAHAAQAEAAPGNQPLASQPLTSQAPANPTPAAVTASTDLPDIGSDYRKARRILMGKGFRPTRVSPPECRGPEPSVDACWGALVQYPEIEACAGGLKGSCTGWWLAPDNRVLKIQTQGDSARIRDRHWASPGEVDELPDGWRP